MAKPDNLNLVRARRLTHEMLALADEGDRDRLDASCAIVFGILRDTAYRLRKTVDEECLKHQQQGRWDAEGASGNAEPAAQDAVRRPE